MKGDFTRDTFRPDRRFSAVRFQQGRVQLDADLNEQADIAAYRDRVTAADVIGRCGAPLHDAGFAVTPENGSLSLSAGRYYAGGVLCENDEDRLITEQPDLPADAAAPGDPGVYLAYLDVWQRHLTALEEPSLREVALDGPDTATRLRTVWQVRLHQAAPPGGDVSCLDFGHDWVPPGQESTGRLRAQAAPPPPNTDVCLVPPEAGYRRLENQLYRVEVHAGSGEPGGPSFVWSRDNGTVVARLEQVAGDVLTVSDVGKDELLRFAGGQWVELTDEERIQRGEPGILVELDRVEGNELFVRDWPAAPPVTMADFGGKPTVRRWDSLGAVPLTPGDWLELEGGVQVEFAAGDYRSGDYWLIPARTITGTVEWPRDDGDDPVFEGRHGTHRHYCPLAVLEWDGTNWDLHHDCRLLFPPLTELESLFYVGGDGQEAMPGDPLPQLLEVGVFNGRWPVAGRTVRFTTSGAGRLAVDHAGLGAGTDTLEATTGADGVARCAWRLDPDVAGPSQQTEARLLDDAGDPTPAIVRFTGNLSIAEQVFYDPGECAALAGRNTVQEALERLAALVSIYPLSGDGQEFMPGAALEPLRVLVASPCGPVRNARVRFAIIAGGGTVNGNNTQATVQTNADGIATCNWAPGTDAQSPQVEAQLLAADGTAAPTSVRFTANLSRAALVEYDPRNCPGMAEAGVETVQAALDFLCVRERGGGGGCCITVGRDGEFQTLQEALGALQERRLLDLCLCLLPGDHQVNGGLEIRETASRPRTHLRITGCGGGTRVRLNRGAFLAHGLASLTLQDFELQAVETNRPLFFDRCQQVRLSGCQLRQTTNPTDLLTIRDARLIRIENCRLQSYWDWNEPDIVAVPGLNIPRTVTAPFLAPVTNLAGSIGNQLVAANPATRRQFAERYLAAIEASTDLTEAERRAKVAAAETILRGEPAPPLREHAAVVGVPTLDFTVADAVRKLVLQAALVIADAEADTTLVHNQIEGDVRFYGSDGPFENQAALAILALGIRAGAITFTDPRGGLLVQGNRLTQLSLDAGLEQLVTDGRQLRRLFGRCLIADNWFELVPTHVLGPQLTFTGNHFETDVRGDVGILMGGRAIVTAADARMPENTLRVVVPNDQHPRFEQAANLMNVVRV